MDAVIFGSDDMEVLSEEETKTPRKLTPQLLIGEHDAVFDSKTHILLYCTSGCEAFYPDKVPKGVIPNYEGGIAYYPTQEEVEITNLVEDREEALENMSEKELIVYEKNNDYLLADMEFERAFKDEKESYSINSTADERELEQKRRKIRVEEATKTRDNTYAVWQKAKLELERADNQEDIKNPVKFSQILSPGIDFLVLAKEFCIKQPYFYNTNCLWWFWNSKEFKWILVDETDILVSINKITQSSAITNSKIKNQILEAMKIIGREHTPKEPKKTWVQFYDVIVDVESGEQFKATPQYFITNPIPYKMGYNTNTPIIDKLFVDWVGEDYKQTLYEICAYCCLADMPLHRIFCLSGEGGNGKSTFIKFIERLIGKENITSSSIDRLTRGSFETAKLYRKSAVVVGEIDKSVFSKTAVLKSLSGDDLMPIEFKGKNGFDIHNYAKPIIATNKLPETTDRTIGFFRRWCIVDFPNTFNEKQNVLSFITKEEMQNFCAKIPLILHALLENGTFTNEGSITEKTAKYIARSSPIEPFLKECCTMDANAEVSVDDLYSAFITYLDENGHRTIHKDAFGKSPIIKQFEVYNKNIKYEAFGEEKTTTARYRKGLMLKV